MALGFIKYSKLEEKTFFHPWIGQYYFAPSKNMFGNTKILILGESHYCDYEYCSAVRNNCGVNKLDINNCIDPTDKCHVIQNAISNRKNHMSSVYAGPDCNYFTISVIKDHAEISNRVRDRQNFDQITGNVEKKWFYDFYRTEKYIMGHPANTENQFYCFWNSIAFYNYVQTAWIQNPTIKYLPQDFELSKGMLQDVINSLEPDIIVAWGQSTWSKDACRAKYAFDKINGFTLTEGKPQKITINGKPRKYYEDTITTPTPTNKTIMVLVPYHPSRCNGILLNCFSKKTSAQIETKFKDLNSGKTKTW